MAWHGPQVYNHQLFWESMRPGGGGAPAEGGPLAAAIARDFPKGGLAQLQVGGLQATWLPGRVQTEAQRDGRAVLRVQG